MRHVCGVCGKGFTMRGHYIGHMNMHNQVKAFQCTTCSKTFAYRTSLRTHIRNGTCALMHVEQNSAAPAAGGEPGLYSVWFVFILACQLSGWSLNCNVRCFGASLNYRLFLFHFCFVSVIVENRHTNACSPFAYTYACTHAQHTQHTHTQWERQRSFMKITLKNLWPYVGTGITLSILSVVYQRLVEWLPMSSVHGNF